MHEHSDAFGLLFERSDCYAVEAIEGMLAAGEHAWYRCDEIGRNAKPAEKVDTRGAGGFCVAYEPQALLKDGVPRIGPKVRAEMFAFVAGGESADRALPGGAQPGSIRSLLQAAEGKATGRDLQRQTCVCKLTMRAGLCYHSGLSDIKGEKAMRKSAHNRNRCVSTETRGFAAMIIAAVFAMVGITSFAKDASDGLIAWWRVEPGENGAVFTAADLKDHAHAGTTATAVNHATTDGTYPAVPVCHTNIDLTYPAGSGTIPNAPCIYFPQPTNYNASGDCVANRQNIVFPADKIDVAGKPFTFIVRINPQPRVTKNSSGSFTGTTIFAYDYSYGANTGWRVFLRADGQNWSYPAIYIGNKDTSGSAEYNTSKRTWMDFGFAVIPNVPTAGKTRVIIYQCNGIGLTDQAGAGNLTTVKTGDVATVSSNTALVSRKICIGDETGGDTWGDVTATAGSFRGLIHEMKLYDRALTKEEFEQACAPSSDPLFTVGSKNGSADEFSDSTAEAVYDADSMPWCKLRKTLTEANPSLSIRKPLSAIDLTVPRILEFAPIYSGDCPQDAALDVLVNGTMVERVVRNSESDRLVYISTNVLKRLTLVDDAYPLTLTLRRTGGMGGTVSFDRIMLGGGWQLGVRDRSYSDFMTWSGNITYSFYRYFLARNDIKILADEMYGMNVDAKQASLTLCFSISDALAAKGEFVFGTRPLGSGTVDYYLNGDWLCTKTITSIDDYELHFGIGSLRGGINELKATWTTTPDRSSRGFDYFRLTPKRFPKGMVFILR